MDRTVITPQRPTLHRRVLTLVLAVAVSLVGAITWAPLAHAAVGVPVSYLDHSYASTVTRPSENKPQSKLWFHDGSWWAIMVSAADTLVRIHELMPDHTWRDTGTLVDNRLNGTGDALWSKADSKLYVATRSDAANLRVAKFSYNPAGRSWSIDAGFPTDVITGGSESASIDRDSTGRLWVTYTRGSRIYVANSDPGGLGWTAGFMPAVPDVVLTSDDISTLIAFGTSIGVMWSDQQSGAFRFAIHEDGAPNSVWRVEDALAGTNLADDHLNIKQLSGDSRGRLFAAIKTSQDAGGPSAMLTAVLVRTPRADGTGVWTTLQTGTVADDHTRPILMIDETNQELYFFATAPVSGGDIFYKKTSLANPSFGPGRGALFLNTSPVVNNASGSKDPVSAQTGLVILAVAEGQKRYAHAEMELAGGGGSADTTAPTAPANLVATPSTGQVALTWNAATDNVGVTGYTVLRDGTPVANPTGTTYTDTAVTAGQTYTYTVTARDAAGNVSPPSTPVDATVPQPPAGGSIALRGVSTAANNAEATLTIPAPARQSGDLMLATVEFRGSATVTPPAGWQLVRADVNGTALRKSTFWHTAGGTETASYQWRFSAKPAAVGSISAYSGVSTTAPIQGSAGLSNAGSQMITAPALTTTEAGTVVVGLFGLARLGAITPSANLTERSEVRSPSTVAYPVTATTADLTTPTPAGTGPLTATSTVAGPNIGQSVALTPGG